MKQIIKSISEAYSKTPIKWEISDIVKEIKLEKLKRDTPEIPIYIGYDFEGRKLFQYLADSVNVEFLIK